MILVLLDRYAELQPQRKTPKTAMTRKKMRCMFCKNKKERGCKK